MGFCWRPRRGFSLSNSSLQTDERIVFAFVKRGQWNSYKSFLTDRRILVRDVKGLTGKSIKYKSISYHLCRAWAISTAGGGMVRAAYAWT